MLDAPKEGSYYWARHSNDETFVVYYEEGLWYCAGVYEPINDRFKFDQVICEIKSPLH